MKKQLKPIEPKPAWSVPLERELAAAIKQVLYDPLTEEYETATTNQSTTALLDGLRKGKISYTGTGFVAEKWNARLSRELKELGATFDKKTQSWNLPVPRMPTELQLAVQANQAMTKNLFQKYMDILRDMPGAMMERVKAIDLGRFAAKTADRTTQAFVQTVVKPMAVQPKLTPEQRIYVDQDYVETTTKPIRLTLDRSYYDNVNESMNYFAAEEVQKLREMVEQHVFSGRPRAELIKKINGRLHVGTSRAKFIARQETALYTAKLKESQYRASRIEKYRWKTVGDGAVRHSHKVLNNRVFDWLNPPIIDSVTGRRGHPGEDFNCRCTASPIVEF